MSWTQNRIIIDIEFNCKCVNFWRWQIYYLFCAEYYWSKLIYAWTSNSIIQNNFFLFQKDDGVAFLSINGIVDYRCHWKLIFIQLIPWPKLAVSRLCKRKGRSGYLLSLSSVWHFYFPQRLAYCCFNYDLYTLSSFFLFVTLRLLSCCCGNSEICKWALSEYQPCCVLLAALPFCAGVS